jgi:formate hydrogenlyase subunit 3/multisubunit Na+/H+ antiporter MnhD subunit
VILLSSPRAAPTAFADLEANAARLGRSGWLTFLVGFGTKAGLAPVHAWLPDAYCEAPGSVSGLLSGALSGMALLPALRLARIAAAAGLGGHHGRLLLLMGFLSLLVAAVYLPRMRNYNRLLAYSSVEHLGIVAIGIGAGGAAVFAAIYLAGHASPPSSRSTARRRSPPAAGSSRAARRSAGPGPPATPRSPASRPSPPSSPNS